MRKLDNLNHEDLINNKGSINKNFGYYLTGLIEGNGTITVHDKDSKSKKFRQKIIVVFHLTDKPLAERLAFITQSGKVYIKKNAGYVL
jgi:hypothetical protein